MRRLVLGLLAGCSFSGPGIGNGVIDGASGDAPGDAPTIDTSIGIDAMGPALTIPHVLPADRAPGTGDLVLMGPLDTTAPTIAQPGVSFALADADGGGPQLAILHVRNLTIPAGKTVTVTGSHPLVVIAQVIDVEGTLDASASKTANGPGAGVSGAGGVGAHGGDTSDSGGGGGGYGGKGAGGGGACMDGTPVKGGTAGPIQQDINIVQLIGGSPGGTGGKGACAAGPAGGGGGGAVQLTAYASVTIGATGVIDVGGGGGTGGSACATDGSSGGGGGAGGAIVLNSFAVSVLGTLVANGGGGGGAGCSDSKTTPGGDGGDGTRAYDAALGGIGVTCGGNGGDGAAAASPQAGDEVDCMSNGGGGGGGLGRIAYVVPMDGGHVDAGGAIAISPMGHVIKTP